MHWHSHTTEAFHERKIFQLPGCVTKCDRGGGGSKLAKNSVTYFMDGPKVAQQRSRR